MDHYLARWLPALAVAGILLAYAAYLRWKIRRAEGGHVQMRMTYTTTTSWMGWPASLFQRSDRQRKAS